MARGLRAVERFAHLCRDMRVTHVRCVATAAVRDATNGPDFIARAAAMGLTVETLTGGQEAIGAAMGVLSGIPQANGIVGDLGGQSKLLDADSGATEAGVQPAYVERRNDAWRGYFSWVPRGRFTIVYVMRLNGAGRFSLPPSRVEAMYSPAIRAAVPNASVTVAQR